jgi:hypothetical protein
MFQTATKRYILKTTTCTNQYFFVCLPCFTNHSFQCFMQCTHRCLIFASAPGGCGTSACSVPKRFPVDWGGWSCKKRWVWHGYHLDILDFSMPRTFQAFWGFEGRNQRFGWVICRYLQYLDLTSFKPKAFKESLGGFREKCMFEHVCTGRFVTVEADKMQALSDCWHKAPIPDHYKAPNKCKVNRVSWCFLGVCQQVVPWTIASQWTFAMGPPA